MLDGLKRTCFSRTLTLLTYHVRSSAFHQFEHFFISLLACWHSDAEQRPTFIEILNRLEVIFRSQFGETSTVSFNQLQDSWKREIEEIVEQLKCNEKELRSREEEISKALTQQKIMEEALRQKERDLMEREFDVLQRYRLTF